MKKLAPYFQAKIEEYNKAFKVTMAYFLKTGDTILYDYYYSERENYIYNYFSKRLSDKQYASLKIW